MSMSRRTFIRVVGGVGLGGPRNMRTLGQMGVATGYAAALCKKHSATPRVVGKKYIKELLGLTGYA